MVVIFVGVIERVLQQVQDVLIREGVVDVAAVATALDKPFGPQKPQPLGDGGDPLAPGIGEGANADLATDQHLEGSKPRLVAERPEDAHSTLPGRRGVARGRRFLVCMGQNLSIIFWIGGRGHWR